MSPAAFDQVETYLCLQLMQCGAGLAYLHDANIVHADLRMVRSFIVLIHSLIVFYRTTSCYMTTIECYFPISVSPILQTQRLEAWAAGTYRLPHGQRRTIRRICASHHLETKKDLGQPPTPSTTLGDYLLLARRPMVDETSSLFWRALFAAARTRR